MRNKITLGNYTFAVTRANNNEKGSWKWFKKDVAEFKSKLGDNIDFEFLKLRPVLNERFADAGTATGVYFHQDLLAAQLIYKNNPVRHIDIGSRTDGFVAHVASYRNIETVDIRPLISKVNNISFLQLDLMEDIKPELENITDSLSCLHVIEHFGLGRYGDKIDPDGHIKGFKSMIKLLKPKGEFYFSTPMGKQRIEFNAHRVFSLRYLVNLVKDDFDIKDFYYIDEAGDLQHPDTWDNDANIDSNFGCAVEGCAFFILTKKPII